MMLRWFRRVLMVFGLLFVLPALASLALWAARGERVHWSDAPRGSSGQAVVDNTGEAVIQIYAARAYGWRGALGVHPWVATRRSQADAWTRHEVVGWATRRGFPAVRSNTDAVPDGYWFGNRPMLLRELRGGPEVDALIDRIEAVVAAYPESDSYRVWPGPNSNTFIAWLGREIPELRIPLPGHAVGKHYLPDGSWLARPAGGVGLEFSVGGLFGATVGLTEGVELTLMGLTAGLDPWPPAVNLPGFGRVGWPEPAQRSVVNAD